MHALTVIFSTLLLISVSLAHPVEEDEDGPESRIVGGGLVNRPGFEYAVFILRSVTACTGTLLGPEWVLTAGHCVGSNFIQNNGTVFYGNYNRLGNETLKMRANRIVQHPQYGGGLARHDVGLIHLSKPILEKPGEIRYIPYLTDQGYFDAGTEVVAAGWGLTRDNDITAAGHLHEVNITIYDHDLCADYYGTLVVGLDHCLNGTGKIGICSGDSGGPTLLPDLNVQIGINSFGSSDGCESGAPQGLTNVAQHKAWIRSVTGYPLPDPPKEINQSSDFIAGNSRKH